MPPPPRLAFTTRASHAKLPAVATSSLETLPAGLPMDLPPHVALKESRSTDFQRQDLDFIKVKADLEEQMLCNKVIDSATSRIKPDRLLSSNGKNFAQWVRDLCNLGRDHLNNVNFFSQPNSNRIYEKIGRAILLSSIDGSLIFDVQDQTTVYGMVKFLMKRFKSVSRAAQVSLWKRLLTFSLGKNHTMVGAVTKLRDMMLEWESMGITFSNNIFLGFIVQTSITPGTRLQEEVDCCLEQYVQQHERGAPTLSYVVQTVEICCQKLLHSTGGPSIEPPLAHSAEVDHVGTLDAQLKFPIEEFLADFPQDQWSEAIEIFAARVSGCWHCGKTGHTQRVCPTKRYQTWQLQRYHNYSNNAWQTSPPLANKSAGNYFYPMVGAVYPPVGGTPPNAMIAPPNRKNNTDDQQLRKANYYQPNPNRAPPKNKPVASARLVDLGDLPDDVGRLEFHDLQVGGDTLPPGNQPTSRE